MKFDAINTVETDTLLLTNDQDGSPKYYAIFLTDATLSIEEESGDWQSSLSNEQWKGIDTYQARYGVRSVSLSSYPSAALGMKVSPVPGLNDNVYLHPVSGGPLHMEPMPLARENIYIVPAQVDLGDDQTFNVTTAMVFTNTADPPANDPDHIAAALIISVSGAERMHFFLSTSYGVPHGETLANSMVAWSTEYVEPADKGPNTTLFIALGVVGGLILLVALGYCCMRCCRRWSEGIADTSIKAYDNESWEAANRH
ncbi:hypothetical protein SARC_12022 [Sphaeroforma arctica JP610]|uniref:Agd3 CBM87 domain-containing protein n=1 Tax=Sphaeroforma arctica JP610 TaxID=667725 RepID=A0A0L0FF95_9EUKA|nr:hypothetical protein SARC_12022 [Sphaeroforma arctica JP610]KNC75452.1 hypothetical protein SARC_12022 [Sphaeroforma arctica JP610]|eukprot:XP_014149354.1 hypothetical protein SARC_12022 [Sphaeroforma arctica JP610]